MTSHTVEFGQRKGLARIGAVLLHEFRLVIPPTLFFFVGFNLILLTKRLLLADYLIAYTGFLIATTSALIVGKVVLVADKLPFLARFDDEPLAFPILFKTVVYTVLVFLARLPEALVHFVVDGNVIGGGQFIRHELGEFSWRHFIAIQMWIFVLFLIYVTANELNDLFGNGELYRILFKRRSSAAKATRRARIRMLTRLTRLTELYTIDQLADRNNKAHVELVGLLRGLAEKR
jgi:hypothetical protein